MALSSPELLTARHDVTRSSFGQSVLDPGCRPAQWPQETGFTFVMVVHDALRVVGYHGLAPTAVLATVMPRRLRIGQPPDPVPCLLLGRLATDVAFAGRGIGTGRREHALARSLAGARLIVVHALDAPAAAF